jgi:hypothetical protein
MKAVNPILTANHRLERLRLQRANSVRIATWRLGNAAMPP